MTYRRSANKQEDPRDAADIDEMRAAARKRVRRVGIVVFAMVAVLAAGIVVYGFTWKREKRLRCHKVTIVQVYDNRPSQPNGQERTIQMCEWK